MLEQTPPLSSTKSIDDFSFAQSSLMDFVQQHHPAYIQAEPFPHIVIDNFLPEEVCEAILAEFPSPEDIYWKSSDASEEKKLGCSDSTQLGRLTQHVLQEFNSSVFIRFLERLTGIPGLIGDPHFTGGGLHQIQPGGFLKIHADFNWHRTLRLDRRLNLLLYLNKDWSEDYGGQLELWDKDMQRCVKRVLPVFNRCVIFSTTSFSYHGHPDPLTAPDGRTRKSLALYYYSNGRPQSEMHSFHGTRFQKRPGEHWSVNARSILRRFFPPIFIDLQILTGKLMHTLSRRIKRIFYSRR